MMHLVDGVPPTAANVRGFLARRAARIYGWYLPCALFALALIAAYEPVSELARIDVPRALLLASVHMPSLILPGLVVADARAVLLCAHRARVGRCAAAPGARALDGGRVAGRGALALPVP